MSEQKPPPKIEAEIPDKFTLAVHNYNLMAWVGWILAGFGLVQLLDGHYIDVIILVSIIAFTRLIKMLVCGWVHTFIAYCQESNDPGLRLTYKKQ